MPLRPGGRRLSRPAAVDDAGGVLLERPQEASAGDEPTPGRAGTPPRAPAARAGRPWAVAVDEGRAHVALDVAAGKAAVCFV